MNTHHTLLHLSLIDGVGSSTIATIIAHASSTFDINTIYGMSACDIARYCGLSMAKSAIIVQGLANTRDLEQELVLLEKNHISWATVMSDQYPQLLKNIHMLPPVLYWRGSLRHDHQKMLAFVGSRDANVYGQDVIHQLIPPLVEQGYAIVSGGARGADAMAHRATLQSKGHTIAVLGSGLLMPYPAINRRLFDTIVDHGGAVVSSFALRTQASKGTFPARNRIIAGLSRGTVVVQAAAQSGALITAHYALNQGREVFAVPGSITDPLSAGCHGLIAQGARVVGSVYDIFTELGDQVELPARGMLVGHAEPKQADTTDLVAEASGNDLSLEDQVMSLCRVPISLDELVERTGSDCQELQSMLFDRQLEGKIRQNFMGMWERVR